MQRLIVSLIAAAAFVVSSFAGPLAPIPASAQATASTSLYSNGTTPTGKNGLIIADPVTGQFKGSIDLPNTQYLLASPDGTRLYEVVHMATVQVYVISTASNSVIDSFQLQDNPNVELSSDGTKLLAVYSGKDQVTILDAATRSPVRTINTARFPIDAQTSPDGKTVYIVMDNSSCYVCDGALLWAVDIATGTLKASIPIGSGPASVTINPTGTRAYVTNQYAQTGDPYYRGKTVSVVDLTTNIRLPSITVGLGPYKVVFTPDGKKAFVANQQDYTVSVVDTASSTVVKTFSTGPSTIAESPDGSQTFLNNLTGRSIMVVDNRTLSAATINTSWIANSTGAVWVKNPNAISSLTAKPTAVVLLQGLGSSLTDGQIYAFQQACAQNNAIEPNVFYNVVNKFLDAGFKCSDFLFYSYTGGTVDSTGRWNPTRYACEDSVDRTTIAMDTVQLQTMLRLYSQAHPGVRFVLLGHSLGGVIAFQTSPFTGLPAGTVPAVITVDSPLNHASLANRVDIRTVLPLSNIISARCDLRGLLYSDPADELGNVTTQNRQTIRNAQSNFLTIGRSQGISYMTTGNKADCLWNLNLCGMPRKPVEGPSLQGLWVNDSNTMYVDNADTRTLYGLGTVGCDLSDLFGNLGLNIAKLGCLNNPHGVALSNNAVMDDILSFLRSKLT